LILVTHSRELASRCRRSLLLHAGRLDPTAATSAAPATRATRGSG